MNKNELLKELATKTVAELAGIWYDVLETQGVRHGLDKKAYMERAAKGGSPCRTKDFYTDSIVSAYKKAGLI